MLYEGFRCLSSNCFFFCISLSMGKSINNIHCVLFFHLETYSRIGKLELHHMPVVMNEETAVLQPFVNVAKG